jgi:hypothetical protein
MVNKDYWKFPEETIKQVSEEINKGLEIINKIDNDIITIFGSAQIEEGKADYEHCKRTAFELGKKGFAIVTGGMTGIMRAANTGAKKAGAPSVGIRAKLIKGKRIKDNIYTEKSEFEFIFLRRFIMYVKSKAWIFYPGGIGTLDELFECMQLRYTGVRNKKPIICVNKKYWEGLFKWLEENAYKNKFLIHGKADLKLVHFVDSTEEILKILEK